MTVLDRYSDIGFTCFTQDLKEVRAVVRRELTRAGIYALESEADVDLTQIYTISPRPGGKHPKKVMFFCPKSHPGSTVMFANLADSWMTLAVCVSKFVSGPIYCFALGSDKQEWPRYLFETLEGGKMRRHVSVIKDVDRWKFWQVGEPLPEEDVAIYRKRRIRDRLDREYLVSLAERLGFSIGDDCFWQSNSKAVYFEEKQ